jgi:CubicO group peptidase (beta-lactamase class C family)
MIRPRTPSSALVRCAVALTAALVMAACTDVRGAAPSQQTPSAEMPTATSVAATSPTTTSPLDPTTTVPASTVSSVATDPRAIATRALFDVLGAGDPGCSVAVARDGEIVYREAFGNATIEPWVAMTPDTVVDIGSDTKQFVGTAVLLLVERGAVSLDASLSTYLHDLPSWATQVTVEQALHHTSGIPDYIVAMLQGGAELQQPADLADALGAVAAMDSLDFTPGDRFAYSNTNYLLLGEVVARVSGHSLAQFVTEEIFRPSGMRAVMDPTAIIAGKATSYLRVDGTWQVADSPWSMTGDGGIQTTPTELALWGSQYWSPTVGGPSINDERIAGAVAMAGPTDAHYGAGVQVVDVAGLGRVLYHLGSWGGFFSDFAVVPAQHLSVVASCTAPQAEPVGDGDGLDLVHGRDLLQIWADR